MQYTISEVIKFTGVSRQAIYSKLNHEEVKPFVVKTKNGTFIKKDGIEAIKKILKKNQLEKDIDSLKEKVRGQEHHIELLKGFLKTRDIEIKRLENIIENLRTDKQNLKEEILILSSEFHLEYIFKISFWKKFLKDNIQIID